MKNFYLFIFLSLFFTSSFSQATKYNKDKGNCNLYAGEMARIVNARDYKRPIATVQLEVEKKFVKFDISLKDRIIWNKKIVDIYNSKITSDEVWNEIRPIFEKMPGNYY